ncbi:MAG: AmmeMemoRadiSam system protein A [Lachnospiraceae bacterium]|nr:AmmeMemoRadiSam system protein A [Lachnospiraceae bacterium]
MSVIAAFMVPHPPMIIPDVGRGRERQIEETIRAYETVAGEIARLKPDTIVISSPHATMYADYFHISPGSEAVGTLEQFQAPGVSFREEYDTKLVHMIQALADENAFPAGTLGERERMLDHGTMIPLYFIRQKYEDFRLVRLGLSGLPLTEHYALGQLVQEAADRTDTRVVFVASGDLSHKLKEYGPYGFAREGVQYDERIMNVCGRGAFGELFDFDESFCEKAAECGHRSFVIMAGALDGLAVDARRLSHEDVTGVGYGICSFYPLGERADRRFLKEHLQHVKAKLDEARKNADAYVRLAHKALEAYVTDAVRIPIPEELPQEMMTQQAGAFVSIHEHGMLRGCIGTILPTKECLAREIIDNAISAATADPRFSPIEEKELAWLEIHVDILGKPELIDSPEQLDVKRYGVIVSSRGKRGLLLPDLDGIDTVEQQISIAMRKGRIDPDEDVTLERFEVTRHT